MVTIEDLPPAIAGDVRAWLGRVRSPHSRRAYLGDVAAFVLFASLEDLGQARYADLVDWRSEMEAAGLSRATVRRRTNALKSLAAFAFADDRIPRDFGALAKTPKVTRRMEERILPFDYVAMMFAKCESDRDRVLLRVLYYSAIRNEELTRLRWGHLTVGPRALGQLSILGKGDQWRYVLIPAFLYGALIRLRGPAGDDGSMFIGRQGRALSTRAVHALVARIARRAHVPGKVSPHWLRHAHVSHAIDGRAPIALVQRDAGHASLETTGRYAHSKPTDGSSLYLPIA